ncbi:hypothetical protein BH11PSE5_BH11PSE5_28480 [soil metagenome]|jgi:hypothetical protein|nr:MULTISPECIES: hypothetical protein [unclassified Sphingobium]GLI98171.1 hypothetical protein Sbs19_19890 [Sphingobium sp. BS19]CAH0348666.1 hypothetical protein SPH9361_00216 [Sphingobium sp. CECT 9361]|tara:strand:+ start:74 stop:220 length:147 start_codon:yes stop_codon:yes gene_type:complete
MIHLTMILVDLLTGLIEAGGWALLIVGTIIAGALALIWGAMGLLRKMR